MSNDIVRRDPNGRFCRAVEFNGMVFLAGLTAQDKSQDIRGQTEQALKRIDAALASSGTSKARLLQAVCYISDMRNKDGMDAAWKAWVDEENQPARATVEVRLGTSDTLIEIMATAAK